VTKRRNQDQGGDFSSHKRAGVGVFERVYTTFSKTILQFLRKRMQGTASALTAKGVDRQSVMKWRKAV